MTARPRALPLVALTAGAALLAGCGLSDPYAPTTSAPSSTSTSPPTRTAQATAPAVATTPAPQPRRPAGAGPALSPSQAATRRAATRAARTFLRGYLPYSYGQHSPPAIHAASPALRRELAVSPPRVPAVLRRNARPRVTQIELVEIVGNRVFLSAQVDERRRDRPHAPRYALSLTVVDRGGRWVVTEVR